MILVDTSVWIDFLRQSDQDLVDIMKSYLKRNDVFAISAVFGELLQGAKNKREQKIIQEIWLNLPKINEEALFIKAGHLSNKHRLYAMDVGIIDCYILAGALDNDLALWTLDKKLMAATEKVLTEN
ncbi:PIN domain-containing protein [Marinoscillum furvescens]|uniref:PIN domain-containing protein n=1 Tax=Marinoscillum furvescens DSM 4134 TaxID=1122208 RepID=A0A3D9L0S6_MARFU|nr:PIN domain-containing protein [Marinoscillum furvescens]RED96121.1 hypothetical protein C7460_11510 [Marinoscillum furvescens DSM 4134]